MIPFTIKQIPGDEGGKNPMSGFLESEFDQAYRASGDAASNDNVVPIGEAPRTYALAHEGERRFRSLLDALPTAIYTTDAAGRLTYFNNAAAELWGRQPPLGTTEWCGSWKLYWPDGTPMAHDECPMALALKEQRPVRGIEAIAETPDGRRVPFAPAPTPLFDEAGRLIGAVNMLTDISERKRAEDQQSLMMRELHHRVKNTLATVQAIMGVTARSAKTIEGFCDSLIGRISSLAKTHLLLSDEAGAAQFEPILRKELDAFDRGNEGRIMLTGPAVDLPTQLAVTLGMAVHELTTNAVRYGALSTPDGKLEVTWRMTIEANGRRLDVDWVESGGPAVAKPKHKGFGTRLLEIVLPGQIQAKTKAYYRPEGLHLTLSVPLPTDAQT
jgi:PAS domain S-box-containing protein